MKGVTLTGKRGFLAVVLCVNGVCAEGESTHPVIYGFERLIVPGYLASDARLSPNISAFSPGRVGHS